MTCCNLKSVSGLCFLFTFCGLLIGQTERTYLTGTVTDPQGNRIPRVQVVAVEDATGLKRQTESTSQGTYQLADLPPGLFTIQFSKSGFSVLRANQIRQIVGKTGTLNVALQLAGKKEEMDVIE